MDLLKRLQKEQPDLVRFTVDRMVACTLVFEGTRDEVAAQERSVYRIARRHGGIKGGA